MKKIFIALALSLSMVNIGYGATISNSQGHTYTCDQTFDSRKLRYGASYVFSDDFLNNGNTAVSIRGGTAITDGSDFFSSNPTISFTDWIKGKKGVVSPRENGTVLISNEVTVNKIPQKTAWNNVLIRYIVPYQNIVNGQRVGPEKNHTECQPYSISWCGDGILDREFGETCDPTDPNKQGWGNGGCDNKTCKPIVLQPECRTLSSSSTTGEAPFSTKFSCEGVNASNYKIDIKNSANQIINTINGKTGSFNFNLPGTYSATCYADNKTSETCNQIVTVKEKPKPKAICEKIETKNSIERGNTSTFTCTARNTDNYKIKIVDSTGKLVKEIFGRSGTYTFNENGNYLASCYIDNKTTTESSCVTPVSVTEPIVPRIKVDKRDNNIKDIDKIIGENDSQTVKEGEKAVFKITVRNDGTEDLEKITLKDDVLESDVDAPMCDKTEIQVNEILQTKYGRTYLKPGESFDYICEREAEAKDPETYTNKIKVEGQGKISLKKVKDEDPTKVNKSKEPKIKVDKRDNNVNDLDKIIGENDSQTINEEDKAVFKITVRNNGTEDLKNVFLVDDVLGTDVDAPNCDKSIDEVKAILRTIGNRDEIFNIGESFDYTCERVNHKNDSNPYTNLIKVTGVGVTSGIVVKDEDPTEVKKSKEPKIKVDKRDNNIKDIDKIIGENDSQTVKEGEKAVFKITVRNDGTEDLEKITLKDDVLESDVDAPMCDKTEIQVNEILQKKYGRTYLKPGESFDYICEREAEAKDPETYTNKIKVEGQGKISLKKVKDEDPTKVNKSKEQKCEYVKVDKTKKEFECKTTGTGFKVLFKDSNGNILNTIKSNNEKVLKGFYSDYLNINKIECLTDEEEKVSSQCSYDFSDNGGSSPTYCSGLKVDENKKEFECKGTGTGFKVLLKDANGNILDTIKSNNHLVFKGIYTNFSNLKTIDCLHDYETNVKSQCSYSVKDNGGTPPPTKPEKPGNPGGGGGNPPSYCGDGKVQRPNSKGEYEECDNGSKNGSGWCTQSCKIGDPKTFPSEQTFEFGPRAINVIGQGMNPYTTYNTLPYIRNLNKKQGSIYVSQICITSKSKKFNSVGKLFDFTICESINKALNPGEEIKMSEKYLEKVKAKYLSKHDANQNDNVLVTSIITKENDTLKYHETYFLSSAKNFTARVAKGSIKTTGGGISYVRDKNITDAEKVISGVDKAKSDKNFAGTSITESLSSFSKNIGKSDKAEKEGKAFDSKNAGIVSDDISANDASKSPKTVSVDDFKEYNGISGAYILKKNSFEIDSTNLNSLLKKYNGPKTFIIEEGNLNIKTDIISSENIAFVVKGGHINIGKNVKNLNGTYISIAKGNNKGGKITSEQTENQLFISGSLYGNISDLTGNRTYLKVNDKGQLDVGTVVSYGSSVFRKNAPLISTFIDEYVNSVKVAK